MKKILALFIVLCNGMLAQTITVNNTANSPTQLVNLLLRNSCVQVSNISISSPQSVAYFNQNGSAFPISEGIIIRNGDALQTQGPYTGQIPSLSTQINNNTDAYLQGISNASGQTANITDVAFLEFDFTPISNSFSFDFLFASNEYGEYQCAFADIFAFQLTNTITNVTTNLAVIPGTTTPVNVKDIRNSLYNSACSSENTSFFSTYNVNNPTASTLNMRGHTVVMTASSSVIPNTPYHIKLVIGDYATSGFDSAVFLAAGSFNTELDLGADLSICQGNTVTINSNLDNSYTFRWLLNGLAIPTETNSSLVVNAAGNYTLEATKGTCMLTDTVVVSDIIVNSPSNLQTCNTGAPSYLFNLTQNNEASLGLNNTTYDIKYYTSIANANTDVRISNPSAFFTTNNSTIYFKVLNTLTNQFCNTVYDFDLIINNPVTALNGVTGRVCESASGTNFNLSTLNSQILNGASSSNYSLSYYNSQANATSGSNSINSSIGIPAGTTSVTYWVRMQDVNNSQCFDVTSVDIIVNPSPIVTTLPDVINCSSYVLPVIANGNYFTGTNGTGTPLFAGNTVINSGTIFIFAGPDANGCTNESSFSLTLIDEYMPPLTACGTYTVPTTPFNIGAFYTAPGGPTGPGTLINTGSTFINSTQATINQTIYYYATVNGSLCRDEPYIITIFPIPLADTLTTVTYCNGFNLPPLTNGNYFTGLDGTGTALFSGDLIQTTQTIYVFNTNGNCNINNPFTINIIDTNAFTNVSNCGSFTLPAITFGGYFSAPNGAGTSIDPLIPITSSQIVYYYANTTLLPNCTANLNYNITINPLPLVDSITSDTVCGQFVLPTLTNGTYYALSGGPSIVGQIQYNAGDIIDLSGTRLNPGTYYIYNGPDANGCVNESNFTININPLPPTDGVIDAFNCLPYTIPTPTNGSIYTLPGGPSGGGNLVNNTQVYNTTQTFYIYNINPATNCSISKPFTINYVGINLPDYQNVNVCEAENYTLPVLTHIAPSPENYTIGYFYDPNGINPVPAGTIFNTPNTTTRIYVYAVNGDRIICTQEDSFDIIVYETPNLNALNLTFDPETCGSYVLPTLPTGNFVINYYSSPGGNATDLITNLNITNPGNYTYYVYATSIGNTNCNDEQPFSFTIYPLRDITINGGFVCIDPKTNTLLQSFTMSTGLNPAEYTVSWYLNNVLKGTGPNYTALESGTYEVRFNKLTPDVSNICNFNTQYVIINQSSPAEANFTVSAEFNETSFITTNLTGGIGEYEYQLESEDGTLSNFQENPTFNTLETGTYYVNINDKLGGCSQTRVGPIYVVNYPKFFTPNGDGYNETWNVFDLQSQPTAKVSVFDRYGKLIKQFTTASAGWDGTFNNEEMPSSDYWFTVEYKTQNTNQDAIFKSHFTLKR
jgi:gliding motility-associated-like protein